MRDHARHAEIDAIARERASRASDRGGGGLVRRTLDLQRTAGNRSVAELVARDALPIGGAPAALDPDRAIASPTVRVGGDAQGSTVPVAAAVAQREPCADCPDASPAGPAPASGVTQEPDEQA